MSTTRYSIPAVVCFVALLAACATSPSANTGTEAPAAATVSRGERADDELIRIEVKHDRADGGIATIYLQPSAGVRTTLGTLGPGETKVFTYQVEAANRNVTLMAVNASGQAMTSRPIIVPRGAGLVWSLQVNSLRVRDR